jgi:tRNA A37 threonylcarbamoyladenosine biosynthesis protein TsaE
VYHIDLWRIDERSDALSAVGLDEILENERNVVVVEWADRLGENCFAGDVLEIHISGDGEMPREITIMERFRAEIPASKR